MLLQPVCPERRGPSWVPSRRSRWPSALGARSAPCATAFFSDRAEEACSSGESRAIYTNGHPNERSEEKGGKQQPKLRAPPWICSSMPATCHGARVGVQGLPSAPLQCCSLPRGPHRGPTVAGRSLRSRGGFPFQMGLPGLGVLFLTCTKLFDLHSLHELPFLIQNKLLKVGFDQRAGTELRFFSPRPPFGAHAAMIYVMIGHVGLWGAHLISSEWRG